MLNLTIEQVKQHARNRVYMSGVGRDQLRIKNTSEVFTPTPLVREILIDLDPTIFQDHTKTFLDSSCGDGQFLSEVLIRKMENGSTFEQALSTIYGVDLMPDNVELCRDRLLCGQEQLRHIVEKNIVCANALTYHYRFDGSNSSDTLSPAKTTPVKKSVPAKSKYKTTFDSLFTFE